MTTRRVIASLVFLFICLSQNSAYSAKGDLAVRADLGIFSEARQDKPFTDTAQVVGKCRDVKDEIDAVPSIMWIYRLEKKNGETHLKPVGAFYRDSHGQKSICFDDLAVGPFIEKNVKGEKVSISGLITSGMGYGVEHDEIILVETLELVKTIFND